MAKNPSNETYLAAELAVLTKQASYSAHMAHELCRLGRRYFRLSEFLCNYPDPGEKRERARSKLRQRIEAHAGDIQADHTSLAKACWVVSDGGGLGLMFCTNPEGAMGETRTWLR